MESLYYERFSNTIIFFSTGDLRKSALRHQEAVLVFSFDRFGFLRILGLYYLNCS